MIPNSESTDTDREVVTAVTIKLYGESVDYKKICELISEGKLLKKEDIESIFSGANRSYVVEVNRTNNA